MPELMTEVDKETLNANAVALIDSAVSEVFGMMLGMQSSVADSCPMPGPEKQVSAIVGFAGPMTGSCIIQMAEHTALKVTGAMMGATMTELDNSVKDAIGEVCNMVAGGWKNRLPLVAATCMLSVPTVVTGESYDVHHAPHVCKFTRHYSFDGACMSVTILYEVAS